MGLMYAQACFVLKKTYYTPKEGYPQDTPLMQRELSRQKLTASSTAGALLGKYSGAVP